MYLTDNSIYIFMKVNNLVRWLSDLINLFIKLFVYLFIYFKPH